MIEATTNAETFLRQIIDDIINGIRTDAKKTYDQTRIFRTD